MNRKVAFQLRLGRDLALAAAIGAALVVGSAAVNATGAEQESVSVLLSGTE